MTPAEIAARLTPAQRRALLWLPADGSQRKRVLGKPPSYQAMFLLRPSLAEDVEFEIYRLTPLGQQVRALVAQEDAQ